MFSMFLKARDIIVHKLPINKMKAFVNYTSHKIIFNGMDQKKLKIAVVSTIQKARKLDTTASNCMYLTFTQLRMF